MFFSQDLLARHAKSGLGVIWLAATLGDGPGASSAVSGTSGGASGKRLTRRDYARVNVAKAWSVDSWHLRVDFSEFVISPPEPLALRLSSNLMVGITRVYGQQCTIFYGSQAN
jgi:hypothetical protein